MRALHAVCLMSAACRRRCSAWLVAFVVVVLTPATRCAASQERPQPPGGGTRPGKEMASADPLPARHRRSNAAASTARSPGRTGRQAALAKAGRAVCGCWRRPDPRTRGQEQR